jgi:hypothetical protein
MQMITLVLCYTGINSDPKEKMFITLLNYQKLFIRNYMNSTNNNMNLEKKKISEHKLFYSHPLSYLLHIFQSRLPCSYIHFFPILFSYVLLIVMVK